MTRNEVSEMLNDLKLEIDTEEDAGTTQVKVTLKWRDEVIAEDWAWVNTPMKTEEDYR